MPKSKNDPYKRKCAQALNHLAAAILDMNEVYVAFDQQLASQRALYVDTADPIHKENADRYAVLTEQVKSAVMSAAVVREEIIKFIGDVWYLDEESIKVYMG